MTVLMPATGRVPTSLMRREPPNPFESGQDEFDLMACLRLVRRQLAMIVAVSALLTLAAFPVILGLKPVYHASSRLMVHAPLAAAMDTADTGSGRVLNIASEMERLSSRPIAEQVIGDLRLDQRAEFNPALRKVSLLSMARTMLRGLIDSKTNGPAAPEGIDRIIPEYYHALDVRRDAGSDVIQIGFASQDPELAAAVPNRLLDIYLDERRANARNDLDAAVGWVRQRIAGQQARVETARAAANRYREAVGIVSNDAQAEELRSLADLNSRLADVARGKAEVSAKISALEAGDGDAIGRIDVPDSIGTLQRKLSMQHKELDKLLQTYGERADEVVDLRGEMLKVQADLDFEVGRYLQAQRAKLTTLEWQERSAREALAGANARLERSAAAQTELTRLLRVAETEQAALDKLEDQERALVAQAALPAVEVEVLSAATVPLDPQGRGRLFYLLGAMLASISIAVSVAFVREMMDGSLRSHEQLHGVANIAPAGLLPRLSERAGKNLPLVFGHGEGGAFAEAVRAMVMALRQANAGKFPASVLVTSALGDEGKTLVARALAIELAASGKSVLLVDGDLRGGDLGSLLKSGVKQGLNEFLTGEADLAAVIHRHANSGIDFIPRGNPSLHQRPHMADMAEIVDFAKASGRLLIIDSAPILSSTDTAHLASMADVTLLVVKWGKTGRRAVEAAARRLEGLNKSETLIVVNNVNPKRHALYAFADSGISLR